MTIEKLNLTLVDYEDTDHAILEKINELIEQTNKNTEILKTLANNHNIRRILNEN